MKKSIILFLLASACNFTIQAQQKEITLKDVWDSRDLIFKGVPGFNSMKNGKYYSAQDEDRNIVRYEFATGKEAGILVKKSDISLPDFDFEWGPDEQKLLLHTGKKYIYRHSFSSNVYIYDLKTRQLVQPTKDLVMLAEFSPDGTKLAYVKNNDLYYYDINKATETRITDDGKINNVINGATDWVYEEEFALAKGYYWNANSTRIAYYRFDESAVKEFDMAIYGELYPKEYKFKYPKAGEANSVIGIYTYDLSGGKKQLMNTGNETDIYIPRIAWTKNNDVLCIQRMNRHQNKLELLMADAVSGNSSVIYTEENKAYVEVPEITFLKDGETFIINSEKSGWNHLYLMSIKGAEIRQLTSGNWDVDQFYGVDEKKKTIYVSTSEVSSTERYVYGISLDGKSKKQLTQRKGWNTATFNSDYSFFLLSHSSINTPPYYALCNIGGKELRTLEDNKKLADQIAQYPISKAEITSYKNAYGEDLNAFVIKPLNFDPSRKYPVLMYVYGGPGHQLAVNRWMGSYYFWYQLLAAKGYMIVCTDGRGTGFKGEAFKKSTYLQLGKYEIEDQIHVAKELGKLPYVDKTRIGIWGWSYGGYMASLGITKGADVFKTAIAVAPVTNWRYYDNIYTERFMRTPAENGENYDSNSPINHISKIKGNYLIIHGTADDNVHFQNAVEMVNAMINKNIHFDSEYYPNKNHGISGGKTRLHLFDRITTYIIEKL